MQDLDFDALLARVTKPARYTNAEWNAVHKDAAGVRARFALVYPDVYEVGMSHLGLHILYHILNSHPDYLAERAFAPWPDMERELAEHAVPLASLESRTPLREFDVIGITLPYELTYTNVLNILDLAGVPLRAAERGQEHPLVIGGGTGAANPEPLAEFLDAVLIGEGEEAILEIAEAACAHDRAEALARLAEIDGVYVPAFYEASYHGPGPRGSVVPKGAYGDHRRSVRKPGKDAPDAEAGGSVGDSRGGAPAEIVRRFVADLDAAPFPVRQIVPYLDAVHSRVTLEIMRGCARGCRFCQAGATYRPRRQRSVETLLRQAEEAIAATGYDEVSLLAFTSVDYAGIEDLVGELVERLGSRGVGVALPSLRADAFSVALANKIQKVRKTGLTFAPEVGTDRLRRLIGKQMAEDDLFAAADAAFSSGWDRLKLYFMIGLPTETDEDVEAIGDLVHRLVSFGRGALGPRRGRLKIGVSVANFVPKAHTPFQWAGQESCDTLARKQGMLQRVLRSRAVKLSWTDPETSALEAAVARGDRRVGRAVEAAWRMGAKFDAWGEHFDMERWRRAFEETGLDLTDYANSALDFDDALAWDHIACGLEGRAAREAAHEALGRSIGQDSGRSIGRDSGRSIGRGSGRSIGRGSE